MFLAVFIATAVVGQVQPGELVTELPTLHCLGFRWFVGGAKAHEARVKVEYRRRGAEGFRPAMDLFRVETAAMKYKPPEGFILYAGSVLSLEPDTEYEARLTLVHGSTTVAERTLVQRTWTEPVAPAPKRTLHVVPGSGGGSGAEGDPIRGLAAAVGKARPGDLMFLHKGVYTDALKIKTSGTPDAPIVWRAAGDGEAIIDTGEKGVGVTAYGRKHIFFENLTFRNQRYGFHINGSQHLTIRRCTFTGVGNGIFGDGGERRIFVSDNHLAGRAPFPKPEGYRSGGEYRGVELSGTGTVICYNRIHNFRDGIDTRPKGPVCAIDIHNNEIYNSTDDGIELDFSDHNTRVFLNRLTNVPIGISFQPIHGGPAYAVRNALYNVSHESFKLHLTPTNKNSPNWREGPHRTSGGVIIHNTVVKKNPPFRVWSNEGPAHYFYMRNNLLIGTGSRAIDITPMPMRHCDLDYDAYVAGEKKWSLFANWNGKKYPTIRDFARDAGQEKHGFSLVGIEGIFAASIELPEFKVEHPHKDLRPAAGSPVIDKGEVLPGINDGYAGAAPDIGAYEFGQELPHYGPRPAPAARDARDAGGRPGGPLRLKNRNASAGPRASGLTSPDSPR